MAYQLIPAASEDQAWLEQLRRSVMPRIDRDDWADKALVLVFIAGTVVEARRAEAALTAAGYDYGIDAEEYLQGLGFPILETYTGLGFYVLEDQAPHARQLLERAQLRSGIIEAE